ncbi:MAG: hypothetical protein ACRCVV_21810 [Shewanella sp.]
MSKEQFYVMLTVVFYRIPVEWEAFFLVNQDGTPTALNYEYMDENNTRLWISRLEYSINMNTMLLQLVLRMYLTLKLKGTTDDAET